MITRRLHITGPSGAGVTTLGRALADAYALPHHDTDDYYWLPTFPPYEQKREIADRLRLMGEIFLGRADWVLSGSLDGWGDPLIPLFDLVVLVTAPMDLRVARLRQREATHFGEDAVAPDGWRHEAMEHFVEWASHYEDGTRSGRSRARHEPWLAALPCPVLRLDGARPLSALVRDVTAELQSVS